MAGLSTQNSFLTLNDYGVFREAIKRHTKVDYVDYFHLEEMKTQRKLSTTWNWVSCIILQHTHIYIYNSIYILPEIFDFSAAHDVNILF